MTRNRARSRCLDSGTGDCNVLHVQYQSHLTPAPRVSAMVARSDTARVKRARIAFTGFTSNIEYCAGLRRPGGLPRKIPGFASPPHDGFALDGGPSRSEHRFMPNLAGHRSRREYAGSTSRPALWGQCTDAPPPVDLSDRLARRFAGRLALHGLRRS